VMPTIHLQPKSPSGRQVEVLTKGRKGAPKISRSEPLEHLHVLLKQELLVAWCLSGGRPRSHPELLDKRLDAAEELVAAYLAECRFEAEIEAPLLGVVLLSQHPRAPIQRHLDALDGGVNRA